MALKRWQRAVNFYNDVDKETVCHGLVPLWPILVPLNKVNVGTSPISAV